MLQQALAENPQLWHLLMSQMYGSEAPQEHAAEGDVDEEFEEPAVGNRRNASCRMN
jgi:hypothetical protein